MNTRNGVEVQVWGMTRKSNTNIGAYEWTVDKGTMKGFLIYTYNVEHPEMTGIDATRITLLVGKDDSDKTDTGDAYTIDGRTYYSDGVKSSWTIYAGSRLDHLEIPLRAKP